MRPFVQVFQKNNDQVKFNKKISAWEKHGYRVIIRKTLRALDYDDRVVGISYIALMTCHPERSRGARLVNRQSKIVNRQS